MRHGHAHAFDPAAEALIVAISIERFDRSDLDVVVVIVVCVDCISDIHPELLCCGTILMVSAIFSIVDFLESVKEFGQKAGIGHTHVRVGRRCVLLPTTVPAASSMFL